MADGTGRNSDRGLSSTAGMLLFIAMGALLTASGAYLMLELGNQDIGQTATTAFDASQQGDVVVIEHTTGESIAGENLRVEGGRVVEMPDSVGSGSQIEVIPTAETVTLFFEDGRVSQQLLQTEVELTRVLVTVENTDGEPLAGHPVGIYDLGATPGVSTPSELLSATGDTGGPPAPLLAGTTNQDGQFVTVTTHRDGLERDRQYVALAATRGPAEDRAYAVETVFIDERENELTVVLSG
jgi:hypothetical protein